MVAPLRVGIAGLGTVGAEVVRLIERQGRVLSERTGRGVRVVAVTARSKAKKRGVDLSGIKWAKDALALAADPEIDCLVELMGGAGDPALSAIDTALKAGKSVVTANKALIAKHGLKLAKAAEKHGGALNFEAAVGAAIPVIKTLREGLAGTGISRVYGILNGTCNYILTRMREDGLSFAAALKEAQELGYAEADPTLDVEGGDAAQKLSVVSMLAFETSIGTDQFLIEGIRGVEDIDFRFADRFGFTLKHLCIGHDRGEQVELRAHPALVRKNSVLANVDGVLNGVFVMGRALGPCLLVGRGAGDMPTAVSVVADIVDVAASRIHGESGLATRGIQLRSRPVMPPDQIETRYYLRFEVGDHPGVLGRIASALGAEGVSIEQMVQEGRASGDNDRVPVCILTHQTREGAVRRAIASIEQQAILRSKARLIRIEDV